MGMGTDIAVDAALEQLHQAARHGDAEAVARASARLSAVIESGAPTLDLLRKAQSHIADAVARLETRRGVNPARLGYARSL